MCEIHCVTIQTLMEACCLPIILVVGLNASTCLHISTFPPLVYLPQFQKQNYQNYMPSYIHSI